ncbi:MAG: phosphate ABC transporter permease subunit PstC [Sandaracinaceae bacterium]
MTEDPRDEAPLARSVPPRPPEHRPPLGQGIKTPLLHRIAEACITGLAFVAIAAVILIFVFVVKEALPLLWDPEALAESGGLSSLLFPSRWGDQYPEARFIWQPPKFNIVPLFVGTLKVTALSMAISIPMGIGSAVFVSQYAPAQVREVVKPALELLASLPSVVLGFFAAMVLSVWLQAALDLPTPKNALVASIAMSLAVVPLIFTISEDALQAVPRQLSEAALALGARKWQTTLQVILPAALPGITAAVILGFGRAIGETMIVVMASGNAAVMELWNPTSSARPVTATIAAELGEVTQGSDHWRVLFLLGTLLFVLTFVINRLGTMVVNRLHRRLMVQEGT